MTALGAAESPQEPHGVLVAREILNPHTGELVPVDSPVLLGESLADLRRFKDDVQAAIGVFEEAILEIARQHGTQTLTAGGIKMVATGGTETTYDVTVLVELLDLGLPAERYRQLVTEVVSYKVNANVAKQIAAAKPEYAAVVGRARTVTPKRQRVSVTPA